MKNKNKEQIASGKTFPFLKTLQEPKNFSRTWIQNIFQTTDSMASLLNSVTYFHVFFIKCHHQPLAGGFTPTPQAQSPGDAGDITQVAPYGLSMGETTQFTHLFSVLEGPHGTRSSSPYNDTAKPLSTKAGPSSSPTHLLSSPPYNQSCPEQATSRAASECSSPLKRTAKGLLQPQQLSKAHRKSRESIKAVSSPSSSGCR